MTTTAATAQSVRAGWRTSKVRWNDATEAPCTIASSLWLLRSLLVFGSYLRAATRWSCFMRSCERMHPRLPCCWCLRLFAKCFCFLFWSLVILLLVLKRH